jgi:hypothetical protein
MTTTTAQAYRFHSDAGHGWLEVSIDELYRLKLTTKISRYSYRLGSKAFLEEDCDATRFFDAKKAAGEPFTLIELTPMRNSNIRNFPRFN